MTPPSPDHQTPSPHFAAEDEATERDPLKPWLDRWSLTLDGAPFLTLFGNQLAPVRRAGGAAMLKIAAHAEECDGAAVMAWWDGDGAARVLERQGDALLLERAEGRRSLAAMARDGHDDEATVILCDAAARLHRPRPTPPPATVKPLGPWFRALAPTAAANGGLFEAAHMAAQSLLSSPEGHPAVLHGDLHHDNVLDFADRGWLAIDPKGLWGDRGYDHANIFCNPWPEAATEGRFERRLDLVSRRAGISPSRLRRWVLAYAGLSAAWTLQAGGDPSRALVIAAISAREI